MLYLCITFIARLINNGMAASCRLNLPKTFITNRLIPIIPNIPSHPNHPSITQPIRLILSLRQLINPHSFSKKNTNNVFQQRQYSHSQIHVGFSARHRPADSRSGGRTQIAKLRPRLRHVRTAPPSSCELRPAQRPEGPWRQTPAYRRQRQ